MEDLQKLREQILAFNIDPDYAHLQSYYKKKSFFNVLGVSRDENRHSAFLHWLLSPDESHGLGDYALRCLLGLIVLVKNEQRAKNGELHFPKDYAENGNLEDAITCGRYTLDQIVCKREMQIPAGRIDVFLSFEFQTNKTRCLQIILENKVKAKEGKEQTDRYYEYGKNTEDRESLYLFLSPLSNAEFKEHPLNCKCKKFIGLNYQYLVDCVLEPCLMQCREEDAKSFIEEYLRTLSQPSFEYDDIENAEIIMAVCKKERELLRRFWERNKAILMAVLKDSKKTELLRCFWESNRTLLVAALRALTDDLTIEEEDRREIRHGLKSILKGEQAQKIRTYILEIMKEAVARREDSVEIRVSDCPKGKNNSPLVCNILKRFQRKEYGDWNTQTKNEKEVSSAIIFTYHKLSERNDLK
ncbi:MAG: PD-(D/E)XK nuclease family protein [Clostridiales bacterium]|nr:PD-(D/E)XK nuclease family protein [Clostridiales bacterium]